MAERWVGSARRECFDHIIALYEAHVRRLAREDMTYYHGDGTHHGLDKDTPNTFELKSPASSGYARAAALFCYPARGRWQFAKPAAALEQKSTCWWWTIGP